MSKVTIPSSNGPIAARWQAGEGQAAVLCVGGFDGGFDGPAGIYVDLAETLPQLRFGVLRLDFRVKTSPGPIADGTADVLAGVAWLQELGVERVALVGHSYGGAIVIRAAARSAVVGVCALATQTAGLDGAEVASLAPRPVLLIHGKADGRLPPQLSVLVHRWAGDGGALHLLDGATHSLRQRRGEVLRLLLDWLPAVLAAEG